MQRRLRKTICTVLPLLLVLCITGAAAETWLCPHCGFADNIGIFCSMCGKPHYGSTETTALPTAAPVYTDPTLEQIPGQDDCVKIRLTGIDATSWISDKWLPEFAIDNDETTCWQFSAKKGGLDGKTKLTLYTGYVQAVDQIWIKNGFWGWTDAGTDEYYINARLKKIRVDFLYNGETKYRDMLEFTLRDEVFTDWQKLSTGHRENVVAVRISAMTSYKGSRFPNDVCLSEIMLVKNAPAYSAMPAAATPVPTIYKSKPDVTGVRLKDKLATRSGPGQKYDEPGTFLPDTWQNVTVRVLGKEYVGTTWWVLVDFDNAGKGRYRVWTGLKRVAVDLDQVKEYYPTGQGTVNATSDTYRGPGTNYAKAKVTINTWKDVVAYGHENGYVEVEFEQGNKWYRLWVPESQTSIDWGNDNSGNG